MDIREVYKLWDRFEQSSAAEFELDMEGAHLSLKKAGAGVKTVVREEFNTENNSEKEEIKEPSKAEEADEIEIKAPLVGTFYRAPSPEDKPFVTIGQTVKKGEVVGIIEAMKMMNEITATHDGVVTAVDAEDGSLVEYDQTLVRLGR
jgi:acetyl-CoA carboxylase biotin carboxyl carrier protein